LIKIDEELAEVENGLWRAIFEIANGTPTKTALEAFFNGLDFEMLEKTGLRLEMSSTRSGCFHGFKHPG